MHTPQPSRMFYTSFICLTLSFFCLIAAYYLPLYGLGSKLAGFTVHDDILVMTLVLAFTLAFNLLFRMGYLLGVTAFTDVYKKLKHHPNSYFMPFWPALNIFCVLIFYNCLVDLDIVFMSMTHIFFAVVLGTIISVRFKQR